MESLSAFSSMSDLPSFSRDDIRYAAEMTRVVYEPDRRIDTFGDTRFNFLLLSELMDEVNVVRVRSGWVEAEKPKIIRPSIYNEISTEGFSGEAKRFFDWLSKNGPGFLTLLEYGFRFKRSEVSCMNRLIPCAVGCWTRCAMEKIHSCLSLREWMTHGRSPS